MYAVRAAVLAIAVAICASLQAPPGGTALPQVEIEPLGTHVAVGTKDHQQVVLLPFGSVQFSAVWRQRAIPVCWENSDTSYATPMKDVRNAIEGTWVKVSRITFTGWSACAPSAQGIRIKISDEAPHTEALGRYLNGRPSGMILNFTFDKWSQDCQNRLDFCAWAIAVHEFGHALGFAHEQNRIDAPFECNAEKQGTKGDWNVTSYDEHSIMNYCNTKWNNDGKLSERDIVAVRTIYGAS